MTCNETRDLFSPLADDVLTPAEREALDAHLAGCGECRRELARFERTVKMVRALDPALAPAGFVDRVLAAAQSAPWPRRLARRLATPWPAIPLGAAALLVVGGLAVLLFRGSVEQQRAVYQSSPPAAQDQPSRPAPSESRSRADVASDTDAAKRNAAAPTPETGAPAKEPAPTTAAPRARDVAPATTPAPARETAPGTTARRELGGRTNEAERQVSGLDAPDRRADALGSAAKRAETEVETPAQTRDKVEQFAKARSTALNAVSARDAPPLARENALAATGTGSPDVTAQLRAGDPKAAERLLVALATRIGGRQTGRRVDAGRIIVQLAVPRDAYAEFVRRTSTLGALSIESQATERPVLAIVISFGS